jgi:hypothetical protein
LVRIRDARSQNAIVVYHLSKALTGTVWMPLIFVVALLLKLTNLLDVPDEFEITRMVELNHGRGPFGA